MCDGSYLASVTVTGVSAPPVSAMITQSTPTTEAGTAYDINWSSTNATSCAVEYRRMAVDSGFVFFSSAVIGSLSPSPTVLGEHIWRITCQGAGGPAVSSFSHQVVPPPQAQSITFGALSARTIGAPPVFLTASASSGLPITYTSNSPDVCTVSGTSVTLVATGTCSITASQAGNATYAAAQSITQTFTVSQTCPTISNFAWTPTTVVEGSLSTLTFNIANSNGAGRLACSGAFNFVIDPYATTSFNANYPNSTAGLGGQTFTCTITARQSSCADTSETRTLTIVALIAQTITGFSPATPITYQPNGTFTLSATGGASGNPVTFASTTPTICTVSGTTATIVSAGTCILTANQAGSATYSAAPQVSATVVINKASQTISFAVLADKTIGNLPFTVSATASSALAVSFSSLTTPVCTVSANTVT
ncbi:MAG: hypothetical protein ACK5VR_05480, partial [Burkholderiales bacterium]